MASREELLQSIKPEMKLDRAFFMKVYGYEISFPGFKDIALKALKDAGCSRADEYYSHFVNGYEEQKQKELYPVAVEYVKRLEEQREKKERKSEEILRRKQDLQQLSDRELLILLQQLNNQKK